MNWCWFVVDACGGMRMDFDGCGLMRMVVWAWIHVDGYGCMWMSVD